MLKETFLFDVFVSIYLESRLEDTERERGRDRVFHLLVHFPKCPNPTARAGSSTPSRSPTWVLGPRHLNHHCCLPGCSSRNLRWHLHMG